MRAGIKFILGLCAAAFGVIAISAVAMVIFMGALFGSNAAAACAPPQDPMAPGTAPLNATLFDAIKINTASQPNSRLALSLFVGTWLESRWNCDAVGAGSYGCYQIQNPGAYPNPDITIEQALSPAYSTNYMLPRYQSALEDVDDSEWLLKDDPFSDTHPAELAAEKVAYFAEKPAEWYHDFQGAAAVHQAFVESLDAMDSAGISTEEFRTDPFGSQVQMVEPTETARPSSSPTTTDTSTVSPSDSPTSGSGSSGCEMTSPGPLTDWSLPLPEGSYRVTSPFGWRVHPIYGYLKFHNGVDLSVPEGTPIRAVNTGTVILAQYSETAGNYIEVEHEGGDITAYMHQKEFDRDVVIGQPVPEDGIIGYVDSTGASTGNHLHFGVKINGEWTDPVPYMLERGIDLYGSQAILGP